METLQENVQEELPVTEDAVGTGCAEANRNERESEIVGLISQDARVGHFIVDVLAGVDPQVAAGAHFPAMSPDKGGDDTPDMDALLAEAEERGYRRGRTEKIAIEMQHPQMWDGDVPEDKEKNQPSILNNMRQSVWDR
ncbi:MAG: hypothetical protein IJY31_07195 [Muribaculaceae bacterium]|nr:hypothetical protein [Muribaculaceae bacterium]